MCDYIRETKEEKGKYEFWCFGCKMHHFIDNKWKIDLNNNTISPSVLVKGVNNSDEWETDKNGDFIFENGKAKGCIKVVCHSFVRNGQIQYLNDCTHGLAGKTVNMVEVDR